ncbi:MAG TPA: ribosome-associated translation inhibitor RaiA [Streptosporangiaceae bacterium]
MDIVFMGRHTNVQDRFRQHATIKLAKLGKLDQKVIRIDVEVSQEHNPRQHGRRERVELTIRSRGPAIRAEAAADDRFAALDLALAKLEARVRRSCDRRKARHSHHGIAKTPVAANGSAAPAAPAGPADAVPGADDRPEQAFARSIADEATRATDSADGLVPIEMEGDGPLVVRQKFHAASPMTIDQALFEMELVGHDFYLFQDKDSGHSSVVYRRCGYRYGVIRLVEEHVPEQSGHLVAS